MGIDPENIENVATATPTLGRKLRQGREQLGLSLADVSERLKLSQRIVIGIEDDNIGPLDDGVFLRGYLISYSRLVGLPTSAIDDALREFTQPVPLIATGTIPKSRYLLDRWSVSATYLILTGLIVGPTVWLAMTHGSIEHQLVRTSPLDRAVQVAGAEPTQGRGSMESGGVDYAKTPVAVMPIALAPDESTEPVKASLAPFGGMSSTQPALAAVTNENRVSLSVSEPSWVEVLTPDGKRLEYGVLPARSERSYAGDTALSVRIGNIGGTRLEVDGKTVDLAPLGRGNVAHLRLFGDDSTVARADP